MTEGREAGPKGIAVMSCRSRRTANSVTGRSQQKHGCEGRRYKDKESTKHEGAGFVPPGGFLSQFFFGLILSSHGSIKTNQFFMSTQETFATLLQAFEPAYDL